MTKEQFAARLKQACASVISAEQELTEIDSKFGDADHGLTMTKIAKAISDAVDQSDGGIQAMLDDAATAVMPPPRGRRSTCRASRPYLPRPWRSSTTCPAPRWGTRP